MKLCKNFNPHLWGGEVPLVNTSLYCGKLICLKLGYQSSYHYHKVKDETFYCLFGEVKLEIGKEKKEVILRAGDSFRLTPTIVHRFSAIKRNPTQNKGEFLKQIMNFLKIPYPVRVGIVTNVFDSVILEVSTHDSPEDNVKLELARKID